MYETDAGDLIDFAQRWANLGDTITSQVTRVVDDPKNADVNPAAIDLAAQEFRGFNQGIDQALDDYRDRQLKQR